MNGRCWFLVLFFSLLLWATCAHAQASPASRPATNPGTASSSVNVSTIAPDAPVITLDGICDNNPYSIAKPAATSNVADTGKPATEASGVCKSVITRSDFEKLVIAVSGNRDPQAALPFARYYAEQLALAQKARELGVDKDPSFETILKLAGLQALSRRLSDRVKHDTEPTDADAEKDLKEHPEEWERVDLLEVAIPKAKQHPEEIGAASAKADVAAEEAAMKAEAEQLRTRAIAGEDFQQLQDEAYKFGGYDTDDSPPAEAGKSFREDVPEEFRKLVFDLPPGKVSELVSAEGYWHFFEVRSKEMLPVEGVKTILSKQRFQKQMDALKASAKPRFNDAYFTPPAASPPANTGTK